jgi:recombinational DNA repair protein (RecF pathway)
VTFHHALGGALCAACAARHPGGRSLPASDRARIAAWTQGASVAALTPREAQAHQRLLREFLEYHLSDNRSLRAFAAWEHGHWDAP